MQTYTEKLIARGAIKLPAYKQRHVNSDDVIARAVDAAEDAAAATARATVEIASRQPDSLSQGLIKIVLAVRQLVEESAKEAGVKAVEHVVEEYLDANLTDEVERILSNVLDDAVEKAVSDAMEDAVDEALRNTDYEERIDRLSDTVSELEDEIGKIERLDDRVDDLERLVGETEVHNELATLQQELEEAKVMVARLEKEIEVNVRELAQLNAAMNKPKSWLDRLLGR